MALLESFVARLTEVEGRVAIAIDVQTVFGSILQVGDAVSDAEVRRSALAWRDFVCAQRSFALNELNGYAGVAVVTFERIARDALIWGQLAQIMRGLIGQLQPALAACAGMPDAYEDPVRERAAQFLANMRRSLDLIPAGTEFDQLLNDRIPELFQLEGVFQRFDLGSSALPLIADQTRRLREAAYVSCRGGDQTRQARLLTLETSDPSFVAASPFGEAALREDIQFCGVRLSLNLIDAAATSLDGGTAGGLSVGRTRVAVPLVPADATVLELNGLVAPLQCPSGEPNDELIGVYAGPPGGALTRVLAISTSNGEDYFGASGPRNLLLDRVRPLLGTDGSTAGGRIVVRRERAVCNGEFANLTEHAELVHFEIGEAPALPRVAGTYSGTITQTNSGGQPHTSTVKQNAGGEVISIVGLLSSEELGFGLAADGTLTLLGVAATGVERDATGMPLRREPYPWRFVGSLVGPDLRLDGYFPSDHLARRWELSR